MGHSSTVERLPVKQDVVGSSPTVSACITKRNGMILLKNITLHKGLIAGTIGPLMACVKEYISMSVQELSCFNTICLIKHWFLKSL